MMTVKKRSYQAYCAGLCYVPVALLLLLVAPASRAYGQGPEQYIVTFQPGTSRADRVQAVRMAGSAQRFDFDRVNAVAVVVPNTEALAALRNNPSVLAIIPDRPVFASQRANAKGGNGKKPGGGEGPGGGEQQLIPAGVARVGAPTGSSNGTGIAVAILDTGVDLAHPDLAGTIDGYSAFGGSCQDDAGHGTHVAGIVGGRDNGADVIGVAPEVELYCVKVLDNTGSGSDATVMAGLSWVLNHPVIRVVNMSLGRPGLVNDNPPLASLMQQLETAGVAVVVSAGNDPNTEVSQQIPAAYPTALPVASTTAVAGSNRCRLLSSPVAADTASYFTTDGAGVIVSAPGEEAENVNRGCFIQSVGILSTSLGGGVTRMSGTSMAAPHVAGIVARYFQQDPSYSVADVRQLLQLDAAEQGAAPIHSPAASYTFDGIQEGVAQAP